MPKRKLPTGMVERKGRTGYYCDFRANGHRIQQFLSEDFRTACQILTQMRAEADKSPWGLVDNNYPIQDLRAAYIKRCEQELSPSSVQCYRCVLEKILGWLKINNVSQITTERIRDYRSAKMGIISAGRINYHVNTLSSMLQWALDQKPPLIHHNPLDGLEPLRYVPELDGRALCDDEVRRLLEVSKQPWRDIWYCLLVTGMRISELGSLRWENIDWENREIIVRARHSKVTKERRIPIEDGLYQILLRQRERVPQRQPADGWPHLFDQEHVFVTSQNTRIRNGRNAHHQFIRCCSRAGIEVRSKYERVYLHSLRKTFATNAITAGADPRSVQEILGHATLEMTMKIYAQVKAQSKRAAIDKLTYGSGASQPEHLIPIQKKEQA